ncbi:MAG: TetR/AcrR family transcriptional regulator [Gammaproteobacteria bacterium]|nr:TetR/AcrR family transcriptional regulator [Gammaproteobacteria bacterium]
MARARNIAHQAALDAAQSLFWQDGYSGVSTRQIEEKTGLTRFTLQTSYGGKKALFLATLDNYLANSFAEFLPRPTSDVLTALANWFEGFAGLEHMPATTDQGCLLLNTITEFERGDSDADQRIGNYFATLRGCFGDALRKGIELGEVDSELDVAKKTELLVAAVLGLNMMIRAGTEATACRPMSNSIAEMICEWRA